MNLHKARVAYEVVSGAKTYYQVRNINGEIVIEIQQSGFIGSHFLSEDDFDNRFYDPNDDAVAMYENGWTA